MSGTSLHQLLDIGLRAHGYDGVRGYVLRNPGTSWRILASEVRTLTDRYVSDVTLASWFADDTEIQAARTRAATTTT